MGYYTQFELEIVKGESGVKEECTACNGTGGVTKDLITLLCEKYEDLEYTIQSGESSKWYDHEEDMLKISKLYPDVVFKLSGEGEEPGDIWVKYFQNGKVQSDKAVIKLAEFDPEKLS